MIVLFRQIAGGLGLLLLGCNRVAPPMQAKYHEWGIDVPPIAGEDDGRWLPVPAAFVIGRDHRVKFASSDPDYTVRISSDRLLRAVQAKQP